MADEFKHISTVTGRQLRRTDWEDIDIHRFVSQALGDILYASSATQLSKLGIGTNHYTLRVVSGIPAWEGSVVGAATEKTADYTATTDDCVILANCSSSLTITLPAASGNSGLFYYIKKIDSSANKVTIDGNGLETIDGDATVEIGLQYQYVTIVCDGAEWHIIGGEYVKMDDILRDILSLEERDKKLQEKILKQLEKLNS